MLGAVRDAGCSGHWQEPAPRGIWKRQLGAIGSGRPRGPRRVGRRPARSGAALSLPSAAAGTPTQAGLPGAEPQPRPPAGGRSGPNAGMTSRSCSPSTHLGGALTRRPPNTPQFAPGANQFRKRPLPQKPPRQPLSHSLLHQRLAPRKVAEGAGNSLGDTWEDGAPFPTYFEL